MLLLTGQSWRILKPGAQVAAKNKDFIAMTAQPTFKLTINDCLTVTIDKSKRTHDTTSVRPQ